MDEKKDIPAMEVAPTVQDLKAVREARGLSLQDIFEATRVTLINLEAVENGEFNRLPPPVYARNFIRKYARAVGIDEQQILNRYEKHLESLKPPIEETEVQKPWPEASRRYRFLFGSLAAVIIAGVLVSVLFLYDQAGEIPVPSGESPPPAQIIATPAQPTVAPVSPAQSITEEPAPATSGESVQPRSTAARQMYHLIIEARELTWIRITEDQNPSYQVLLKPGDKIERMASDFFRLDIGNAGGINLTFQGKPLGSLGKQGQIIHMRLPEKGSDRKSP